MIFAVGSRNPTKVDAVRNVAEKALPGSEVISLDAPSGVNPQPASDEEAVKGATNRARFCLENTEADFGVGIEGAVVETPQGMLVRGWTVILDRNNRKGMGSSGGLVLPIKIANQVRNGEELGIIIDKFAGKDNTKLKLGAAGVLTDGLISRTEVTELGVAFALARFIKPEFYD